MVLIELQSDNWDKALVTPELYEVIVLEMSTGDHATHTAKARVYGTFTCTGISYHALDRDADESIQLTVGGV